MNSVNMQLAAKSEELTKRPWRRALLWLTFLGPFFFISYSFSNILASQQQEVLHIVFSWEKYIPFIPWTIIPYWVIDALYVVSLFLCLNKIELDTHAKRLITAQIIAVMFFIVMPMGFSFERPQSSGILGGMFTALEMFDQPYNQAPSLHIALLMILWPVFSRHIPVRYVWIYHILSILITISVLTTYQHHFIDVPTGVLLGLFSIWLWPEDGRSVFFNNQGKPGKKKYKLSAMYFMAAGLIFTLSIYSGGVFLWLCWPAFSLLLVSINYFMVGERGFQKNKYGEINLATQFLLYPYILAAKINSRLWTKNVNVADYIGEGVWLGRYPSGKDLQQKNYSYVIDLTAELPAQKSSVKWFAVPCLDLIVPEQEQILRVIDLIEENRRQGPLLVCCALGYSRSALAVISWLYITRRESDIDEAIKVVIDNRPSIVISEEARVLLRKLTVSGETND